MSDTQLAELRSNVRVIDVATARIVQ